MKAYKEDTKAKPKPKSRYPYLGIDIHNKSYIVMFTKCYTGTVVHATPASHYDLGETDSCWVEEEFEQYFGTVTLEG